jgi:hypothetical protein
MSEGNPTTQTNDTVLDAEQREKVTAFLAEGIKDFLKANYDDSDYLTTQRIEMDLQDDGKDNVIDELYQFAQPELNEYVRKAVAANLAPDMSWLKLPEEDTKEEEDFRELLDELYSEALDRVSWSIRTSIVVE